MIALDTALRTIHMPEHLDDIAAAQARLRYDEAASLEAVLLQQAREHYSQSAPPVHPLREVFSALFNHDCLISSPMANRTYCEISADISQPHPMNRLLQGEVGSGKTVVALLAMAQAVDNGQQAVLMAPTEVLAQQHARTVTELLGELGTADQLRYADNDNQPAVQTAVTVLTGSLSTAQKRQALLDIVTGRAGIIIGTQALLQEGVEFFRLGLVVIDEQHRFGVRQRLVLTDKGANGKTPHMLVMTATPIPRTIALTSFGDLTVSSLKELPRGRAPITTAVVNSRIHPHLGAPYLAACPARRAHAATKPMLSALPLEITKIVS
ncbi:MAG: DEAD/DEAH box helicase [Lawsonella clevelandensis]